MCRSDPVAVLSALSSLLKIGPLASHFLCLAVPALLWLVEITCCSDSHPSFWPLSSSLGKARGPPPRDALDLACAGHRSSPQVSVEPTRSQAGSLCRAMHRHARYHGGLS